MLSAPVVPAAGRAIAFPATDRRSVLKPERLIPSFRHADKISRMLSGLRDSLGN
jgi:hypothetical protein